MLPSELPLDGQLAVALLQVWTCVPEVGEPDGSSRSLFVPPPPPMYPHWAVMLLVCVHEYVLEEPLPEVDSLHAPYFVVEMFEIG